FFRRYRALFSSRASMLIASTVAFAWLHIVFENWVVVFLAGVAGFIFSWTYMRTRSGFAVGLEHAVYGNALFTIGLGWFFFTGSVGS
ncbi:MAG: CPBP family glutamic-type intramembrane protease, partial [Planctomycetota bacterium]